MATKLKLGGLVTFLTWILRIGGLWTPNVGYIYLLLYRIYSWWFIFTFSVMYTAFMCANIYFLRDISQLTEMLFMSLTELALVLKIINFYVNNSRLQHMLQRMEEFQMETPFEQEIMRPRLAFLIKSTIIYFICANTSMNTSALNAAVSENNTLMYSGYYPGMDWKHNLSAYWSVFAYQYFGILFTCQINLSIDTYFCLMMYMLSGQIIILGNRLANMGATTENRKQRTRVERRLELIKNIKTHADIAEFIQNLQHCLWWSFFSQLILSAVTVGSVANEILRVSVR